MARATKRPTTVGREEVLDVLAALDWLDTGRGWRQGSSAGPEPGRSRVGNTAAIDGRLDALVLE